MKLRDNTQRSQPQSTSSQSNGWKEQPAGFLFVAIQYYTSIQPKQSKVICNFLLVAIAQCTKGFLTEPLHTHYRVEYVQS